MTPIPEEKAKELFKMFYSVSNPQGLNLITHDEAKQCVKIVVEEIKEILDFDLGHDQTARMLGEYWDKVKIAGELL